jgi:hypothetical protein
VYVFVQKRKAHFVVNLGERTGRDCPNCYDHLKFNIL